MRQSAEFGHEAIGLDTDPLSVLMSRTWTSNLDFETALTECEKVLELAQNTAVDQVKLPWIDECNETSEFVSYWFAKEQANDLRKLSFAISRRKRITKSTRNILWLSLSRTIITKKYGASLAWDISHSRPHRAKAENEYDVLTGFRNSYEKMIRDLKAQPLQIYPKIFRDDARKLRRVKASSMDAIITSPPYLNAIDYIRAHKFSLIWMGFSIPYLRSLRSNSVGAERAPTIKMPCPKFEAQISGILKPLTGLPKRESKMIERYAIDAYRLLRRFRSVLRDEGKLVLVLGDSNLRGCYIENSSIYDVAARSLGFEKISERRRPIPIQNRYLPIVSKNNSLENRMRHEVIQEYSAI